MSTSAFDPVEKSEQGRQLRLSPFLLHNGAQRRGHLPGVIRAAIIIASDRIEVRMPGEGAHLAEIPAKDVESRRHKRKTVAGRGPNQRSSRTRQSAIRRA